MWQMSFLRRSRHVSRGRELFLRCTGIVLSLAAGLGCEWIAPGWFIPSARPDQVSAQPEGLRSHPPDVWALTGARVVVSPDITLPKATVVVRHGKIEAVGADVSVPPDARTIDASGKTIYAGLIDAYAEETISSDALMKTARYWNNQVTPQLSVTDQLEVPGSAGVALRKQGVVARLIAPSSGVIRGRSALVSLTDGSINAQLVATDVAQHMELTVPRRSRSGYPGSPMGAVALARQAIYDAQWYRDAWNAAHADPSLPRPETNDALHALLPVLSGSMPVIIETSDELFLQRADKFAAEFGLNLIVRGSGREYRRLAEVTAAARPLILPLAFPTAPNVSTAESADDVALEALLHWDLAPENPARVAAAGLTFAFCSDNLSSKDDFLKSLRKAVERGLPAAAALRALTVTPAELFHVSDQLGTVQAGRMASFVITDGDLFDSKTRVIETWVNGQRFEHAPPPAHKIDGQFQLTLAEGNDLPARLFLEIVQKDDKISGRVSRTPIPARTSKESADKNVPDESASSEASEAAAPGPDAGSDESGATAAGSAAGDTETDDQAPPSEPSAMPAGEDTAEDAARASSAKKKDAEILKLDQVRLTEGLLTASWKADDWKLPGIARLTLVITEAADPKSDQPAAVGKVIWPNGTQVTVQAKRDAPVSDTPNTPAVTEKKDVAGDQPSETEQKKASFPVNYPLGAFGRQEIPPQPKLAAFIHATLWTCGPEGIIPDGILLIADGRIVAAGRDVAIPPEAKIHDVRGMHISPGLIDCHSHAATDGGVNESTQAITCEVRIGDFIDSDDITIYRQLAGGVTSANILHGSANPIGGQNQVIKLRWGMNGEQLKFSEAPPGVKFALGENVKQSNWSEPNGRYPQTRMGVEQLYRDAFQAARDYAVKMESWQKERRGLPPRRNLELDALREIIEGKRWIHCHSYRQDEILALLRILDEYKITIGTFQHILEGYKVADAMAQHGAMASAFSDWWAYKMEVQDAIPYAGALMHSAGVVVSFNSDDGELARHLNQEAAKAIKYGGVSREEALKFVTLNPAKQLRIEKYVGSLEPEKHADFVIWNGDPLSNFSRCEQTWIDGRPYFTRAEDEELREQAGNMRNTLIQKVLKSGQKMRQEGEPDADPADLWPRFDEFCRHMEFSQQIRMLEEQQLNSQE